MTESVLQIRVACYAGYRGEEEPRRLWFDDRSVEVMEILDRWLAPDHRYFKLRGDDDYIYIVRNDPKTGQWELTMFDRTNQTNRCR
ncbi:MAG: hypothetical protein ACXV7F_07060 [Methylomonas sp.]